ncbi:MAG: arsenic efflux protein [Eggerthellaceae bacterium]|nr:arsenic efflux protein [Eggerthellaceae bacterium]
MELVLDILLDAAIDTARLVPFLFVTYLAMEALERAAGDKTAEAVERAGHAGPFVGALLGAFPQCGFSAAAATLYAGRVITLGTLIAVFLATSDEMLPIMIAEQVEPTLILKILGLKVVIGMLAGFVIDAAAHVLRRNATGELAIHELCEADHCHCHDEGGGIVPSALNHTVQVTIFIFLVSLALTAIVEVVGQARFSLFLVSNPELSVLASALVGLIPNCAASVIITELYLEGTLGFGATMAGLLVSAGVGLLVLFRANRRMRENAGVVFLLLVVGMFFGLVFTAVGFSL